KPSTVTGIEKYLGSGMVRGIGKVMAKRLVERFGLETLDVIDQHPERLLEVEGIGKVRSTRIREAWDEQREIRQVMLFLQSHGVSPAFAVKIYRYYKDAAISVVASNPYRLAQDIFGIGFKTADAIAQRLGISKDSVERAEAGVLHVLGELSDEGHVYYPHRELLERAREILEIDEAIIAAAISRLAGEHLVVEGAREASLDIPGPYPTYAASCLPSDEAGGGGAPSASASQARPALGPAGHDPSTTHLQAREDSPVYLKALHVAESGIASLLRRLMTEPVAPIALDVPKAVAWFEARAGIELAEEQRAAIAQATYSKVLVITGGPGTGKTTLVNGIISILEKKGRRILLAAPTGRAAKRMSEATGREACTIHRLLELSPKTMSFQRNRDNPLEADLLIVDEASMIDTVLGYDVLKALPPRCQLVLVGDVDQLPSVGPGSVLSDLIDSGAVPVVRLSQIFRQAQQSQIVVNAHRVNRGELPKLEGGASSDFFFLPEETPEAILATIKGLVRERLPRRYGFDPIDDIQVLTPMRRGLLGGASLNAELQALLNPQGRSVVRGSRVFRVGDKVMQLRNNYDLDVYNGDVGRVAHIDAEEQQVEVRFDGRGVAYDFSDLDELALSYACTVHKSQGSEYPCVVLPLHTQHYPMLQRNLLYTAITRGKRLVVIVGTRRALAIAVRNADPLQRKTRLAERLQQ
ncbi:MAG: AAA family ATPase, partial [Myxococcales bacterium]